MSALLARRVFWFLVCGVLCAGSLFGWSDIDKPQRDNSRNLPLDVEIPMRPSDEAPGSPALQAVGGLGLGHIQSTLGLIGVTADAYSKDVYDAQKVESLMKSTSDSIEVSKKLLRKLQDTKLSAEDEDFVDRMIGAYNALQREARALATFAKSRKSSDAEAFNRARKTAITKIEGLTSTEEAPSTPPPAVEN